MNRSVRMSTDEYVDGLTAAAASDLEFVERRYDLRVVVRIPGHFSLANRRDRCGNRRQFACRAVSISPLHMMLAASVNGPIGERVIAYFEDFGTIQGSIMRVLDAGFIIRIAAKEDDRTKLMRKLIWLEQHKNFDVPDVRRHRRIVPEDPLSTIYFPDGSIRQCFVIDMSASGAAVLADIMPRIGTAVAIGKVAGKVVRHFAEGFAVQFKRLAPPAYIEQLVIHRS